MDLGIAGRRAIVCASSKGLGRACAEALLGEGVDVVINGRDPERLAATATELRARYHASVEAVAGDVTTESGRAALLAACPDPDILVNNNAGPEPGPFAALDEAAWMDALSANMVAPLLLIRAVLPTMIERKFGRIVNITSAMVTTPRANMALSSGPRAGLTAALKGLTFELAPHNVTINNLLPERFDTDRQLFMANNAMKTQKIDYDEARKRQIQTVAAKRLGRPEEFGATCAFVCSAYSGYLSGQNVHLDGGTYPALI